MFITVTSTLGNKPKTVKNGMHIDAMSSIDALLKMVVTDKEAIIQRKDGRELQIVYHGCIYTEVFNQKELLLDWINLKVDTFPEGGIYAQSSI